MGHPKEETFIDRKRKYRSQLDRQIGPSMLITVVPSIAICVFVVLAAPYMKSIVEQYIIRPESQVVRTVDLAAESEPIEDTGPPPSADAVILEITKRRLAEEGFDIHAKPVLIVPTIEPEAVNTDIKPLPMMLGNPELTISKDILDPK